MNVYKDSNGNFVCKMCYKSYLTLQEAIDCSNSHIPAPAPVDEKNLGPTVITANSAIDAYHDDVKAEGTIKAAERLMLSLIEDYVISRDRDLAEKGRVGALSLNLGKTAAEAMNNYNKILHGTKSSSLNVNVDASKKSDLDAIKEMLNKDNVKTVNEDGKGEHK